MKFLFILLFIPLSALSAYYSEIYNDDLCQTNFTRNFKSRFVVKRAQCESSFVGGKISLKCTRGIEKKVLHKSQEYVVSLSLFEWPFECFSPTSILSKFPRLEELTIENSTIKFFNEPFPAKYGSQLKSIKIHGLDYLILNGENTFSSLPLLETLDLRRNGLEIIDPDIISSPVNLKQVFLLDNFWNCSSPSMHWMAQLNTTSAVTALSRIADYENLSCRGLLYPGKPLPFVMGILNMLYKECPSECSCHLLNLVRHPDESLVPVTEVDCRYKELKVMPPFLPTITTILRLEGNQITEVNSLAQNPAYRKVIDVYLDDNKISSLKCLEGTDWIMNFRILSVKRNNITKVQIHAFNNVFLNNHNIVHVYFAGNPWKCNCYYTPRLQDLLLKYSKFVGDIEEVTCAKNINEEISNTTKIISLSRIAICRPPEPTIHYFDIINIVLSLLIIIVFAKFGYDYYNFKKFGHLPWIIRIIP